MIESKKFPGFSLGKLAEMSQSEYDLFARRFVAWTKAAPAPVASGLCAFRWRYDRHGRLMDWLEHGNRSSTHGWEVDHYPIPKSLGGSDHPGNLHALHWDRNAEDGEEGGISLQALEKPRRIRRLPLDSLLAGQGDRRRAENVSSSAHESS